MDLEDVLTQLSILRDYHSERIKKFDTRIDLHCRKVIALDIAIALVKNELFSKY